MENYIMDETENKKVTPFLLKYICPDDWSAEKKEERPIDAEEIIEAITDGKKVEIINAVIKGAFILKSVNVEGEITIQRTTIRGPLDWSYSTFKRVLNLVNSTFETDATFASVKLEKDIFLNNATFSGIATFSDITVIGTFCSPYAIFEKDATFKESNFKKRIEFNNSTFKGEGNFASTRIGGNAYFDETVFDKLAIFNGTHIEGFAFFKSATFKDVDFVNARIGSNAEFTSAVFGEAANLIGAHIEGSVTFAGAVFNKSTSFNSSQIVGAALFNPTSFKDEVDFRNVRVGSNAEFTGAMFEKNADFSSAQIEGIALFDPEFLFSLDENLRNDSGRLVEFLNRNCGIKKGKTVGNNDLSLTLNDEKSKAILKSDVFGTYEFIVKTEYDNVNIYNQATFKGKVDFIGARIGTANFNETVFKELVSFNKAKIKDSAFFNSATFEGEADFGYAQIGSNAEFTRAFFNESASFNSAKIEEGAFFNPATFKDEVDFAHARIGTNAEFASTLFKESANFNSSHIGRMAVFDLTTFEGNTDFINARIGGDAGFSGVVFKEQARFYGSQIKGNSFFNSAYLFSWDEILDGDNEKLIEFLKLNYAISLVTPDIEKSDDGATIKVTSKNNQIVLVLYNEESKVILTTDNKTEEFIAKTENKKLNIYKSTNFGGKTSFTRARFGGDARFNGTIFGNNVIFQDTFFGTIYFGEPEEQEVQFQAKIDLRGCIYDRIDPVSFWKQLMQHLGPYDRQPFTQLEETFRRAGRDQLADDVHYEQKSREFTENITIQKPGAWLLDRFLWLLTGYGVRLHYLLLAIVTILLIGTAIFQLEGAVKLDIQPPFMISTQVTLSCWEAFWVSLNTFLPIEIPSGADWKPSSQIIPVLGLKFTTFATFLNLVGWILVPVGVAGISGLLKGSK